MTDVLHRVRASVLIFQGISADFPSFSLIAQPTTTIPPLQTRPTPLHTMHASVFVSGPSPGSVFQPASPSLSLTLSVHYKYVPPRQDRRLCIPCTRRFSSLDLARTRCSNRLPQVVLDYSTHYKYTPSQTWPTPLHIMHASVLVSGPPNRLLARSIFQTCGTAFFLVTERSKSSQHEFECSSPRAAMVGAMSRARCCRCDGAVAQWHRRETVGAMAQWRGRDGVNTMALRNVTLGQAARRRIPCPCTPVWRPRPAFVNNPLTSKATMSCTVEWAAACQPHMQGHRPDG